MLLIEDEPSALSALSLLLELDGYAVLEARSGAEALERCREANGGVDLVVMDAILPGVSGASLVEMLAERCSAAPMIFMSGCEIGDSALDGVVPAGAPFISKPVDAEALSSLIAETIGPGTIAQRAGKS